MLMFYARSFKSEVSTRMLVSLGSHTFQLLSLVVHLYPSFLLLEVSDPMSPSHGQSFSTCSTPTDYLDAPAPIELLRTAP